MARSYYLVDHRDTLEHICWQYSNTITPEYLIKLNNLQEPVKLYVGQVLCVRDTEFSPHGGQTTAAPTKPVEPNYVNVTACGWQTNTDRTIFALWTWNRANTDKYKVIWYYDSGDGHWFVGQESETKHRESTYNAPAHAKKVKFTCQPISTTYKTGENNSQEVHYWTADWSPHKEVDFDSLPPEAPSSAPNVTLDKYTLTCRYDGLDEEEINGIQFEIVQDDTTVYKVGYAKILTSSASYSCTVEPGHNYKVRARATTSKNSLYSSWTDYSNNFKTIPAASAGIIKCRAASEKSVYLLWNRSEAAETYEIRYSIDKDYLLGVAVGGTGTISEIKDILYNHCEIKGLEPGKTYYFQVRAKNEKGESEWSDIASTTIGTTPIAPTTWASTTTVITGERLILYWVHNTEDNSLQTEADIELIVNGITQTIKIINEEDTENSEKENETNTYEVDTSQYEEGVVIKWRVRTAGCTKQIGEWSIQREINVYAPATLQIKMTDELDADITSLTSFPINVMGVAGPNTQKPVTYHLSIIARQTYETVDETGFNKIVKEGEMVYDEHFDTSEVLNVSLMPSDVDLENNIPYTLNCIVSMNSGLVAEDSINFTVAWEETFYSIDAEILLDRENLSTSIRPFCESIVSEVLVYKVLKNGDQYLKTDERILGEDIVGDNVENALTEDGNIVYLASSYNGESNVYFCVEYSESITQADGVTMNVYRRNYDGTFSVIGTGLVNGQNTFVTDPHPSLDYARYRIVAIDDATGATSFRDVSGLYIGEKAVVIQWDEVWNDFDIDEKDGLNSPSDRISWGGSMIKLPYNIDISDTFSNDVSLVKYIGRSDPVSYYGTQSTLSSTWGMVIDKKDKSTLFALRRLAAWMGDVYIREPSGTGYWASISVGFTINHLSLTIPVKLTITRVAGGV